MHPIHKLLPLRKIRLAALTYGAIVTLPLLMAGCGHSGGTSDTDTVKRQTPPPGVFHADNDIAMVARSLCDALAVGEPFDSAAYTFTGVLTDGAGAPLYIDRNNNPGTWRVTVISPTNAVIDNTDDGDLVASDLAAYVAQCLELTPDNELELEKVPGSEVVAFSIPNGYISFAAPDPDGLSGCRITISVADSI